MSDDTYIDENQARMIASQMEQRGIRGPQEIAAAKAEATSQPTAPDDHQDFLFAQQNEARGIRSPQEIAQAKSEVAERESAYLAEDGNQAFMRENQPQSHVEMTGDMAQTFDSELAPILDNALAEYDGGKVVLVTDKLSFDGGSQAVLERAAELTGQPLDVVKQNFHIRPVSHTQQIEGLRGSFRDAKVIVNVEGASYEQKKFFR